MTFTYSNSFEFSSQICFISLEQFFKKPNSIDDFINLGYFPISLKIFILNIIVLLCTLNSLTSLMNFYLSLYFLNIFPWWYMMDIFFFFVLIISLYCFITAAASSCFSAFSTFFFNSTISIMSLFTIDSINCFFISSLLGLFVFLAFLEPFHIGKQKITTILQI